MIANTIRHGVLVALFSGCFGCGDDEPKAASEPDAGSDERDAQADAALELDPELEHTDWQPLFDANLSKWYTFLPSHGRDSDPEGVFEMEDGVLHVLGNAPPAGDQEFGYVATRAEYGDYRFQVEQRWGTTKFAPRADAVRDSGLLYHMRGTDGVWPQSVEFQIQENDIGDLFLLGEVGTTTLLNPAGNMFLEGGQAKVLRGGALKKGATYESTTDWNSLELVAAGRDWVHTVNGQVNHRGYALEFQQDGAWMPLDHGRIVLQAEGAEVFYRSARLRPLRYPPPPPDAVVLFDGTNLDAWQGLSQQPAPPWKIAEGELEIEPGSGDLFTREAFKDIRLHLEFKLPAIPDGDLPDAQRTRSEVFLASRYGVKLRDSFGREVNSASCGAVGEAAPAVNEGLPAETWQSLDVVFHAAHYKGETKTRNARMTVVLNGSELYRAQELQNRTENGWEEFSDSNELRLWDEGVRVRFRNIWLQQL